MITRTTLLALCAGLCLAGCYRPESPIAHMMGDTRTFEQVAADECATRLNYPRNTPAHDRCMWRLASAKRQQAAAANRDATALMVTGAGIAAAASSRPDDRVCVTATNVLYRC